MLFSSVYIASDPRRPLAFSHGLTLVSCALSPNSHGIISFADHHALTATESYRYKITRGEGVFPDFQSKAVTFSPTLRPHESFSCNTYEFSRNCCKQKAYGSANSFRCNTYKKHAGTLIQARSYSLSGPSSPKSLPLNPFADPHPLNLYATIPYKKGGGEGAVPPLRYLPPISDPFSSQLLIDVVFCFKAFQQGLEKRLRRVRRSADRLRHFLGGRREIPCVRRNPGQRQVADPMIRILLRNLRVQFKRALGVARSLQAASVGVQLNRAGFIERLGKQFGGFFFSSQCIENPRFGLQVLKA